MNWSDVGVEANGERLHQCDPRKKIGKEVPPPPQPHQGSSLTVIKGFEVLGHYHLPLLSFEACHTYVDDVRCGQFLRLQVKGIAMLPAAAGRGKPSRGGQGRDMKKTQTATQEEPHHIPTLSKVGVCKLIL